MEEKDLVIILLKGNFLAMYGEKCGGNYVSIKTDPADQVIDLIHPVKEKKNCYKKLHEKQLKKIIYNKLFLSP